MRRLMLTLALVAASSPAFAVGRGGGNDAIANNTTTSMGEPLGSPNYEAPRSAAIPGTPANEQALRLGQDPVLVSRCGTFHPSGSWCHAPLP